MRSNDFGANDECVSVFTLCSCALRALAEFRRVIQLRRVRTRFTSIFNFASVSRLHSGIRVFAVRFSYLVGRWTQLRTNISRSTAHSRPHHIIFRLLCLAIWSRKNVPIASFTKSSSSTAVQTCSHASHTVHVHRARSFFLHRFLFNQSATTMRRQGNSSAEDEEKKTSFIHRKSICVGKNHFAFHFSCIEIVTSIPKAKNVKRAFLLIIDSTTRRTFWIRLILYAIWKAFIHV